MYVAYVENGRMMAWWQEGSQTIVRMEYFQWRLTFVLYIAKRRQGLGKDRQGMALKAKELSKSDGLGPRYKQPCGVGVHVDISTQRQEGVN